MSHEKSKAGKPSAELRMLWYPHLPAGTLSPEVVDEALRRGRQERAEMLASIASRVSTLVKRGVSTVFHGFVVGQERRAETALAQARALVPSEVLDLRAAVRGDLPGPVCEILSHPETLRDDTDSSDRPDNKPRLAA